MVLERFLDKAIKTIFALIVVALPLIVFKSFSLPHELPKAMIFRALVLLLMFFVIWRSLQSQHFSSIKVSKWLWSSFIVYILIVATSTFVSEIPHLSFFGSYYRQQGFIQFIYYVLMFLLTLFYFSEGTAEIKKKKIFFLLQMIALGGILASGYAIWNAFQVGHTRISGSLGQPNFLGNYLLMTLPFAVWAFSEVKKKYLNILWGIGVFFILTAMFLTMSRAMLIGLMGGILFIIFALKKWKILIPIGFLGLFVILLNIFGDYSLIKDNIFLGRFLVKGYGFETVYSRFVIWDSVWEMIKAKPVLGYGPEMLTYAYKPFIPVEIFYYEPLGSYVDRAHNEILDILSNIGFLGLFFYSLFFVGTLKLAYSKIKQPYVLAIFFSLIALFTANLFSFSVTMNFVIWWLLMAILLVISCSTVVTSRIGFDKYRFFRMKFVVLAFVAVIFAIYFVSYRPLKADFHFARGEYAKAMAFNHNEAFYPLFTIEGKLGEENLHEAEVLINQFKNNYGSKKFPEILFFEGKLAYLQKNYKKAISYFEQAYEKTPKNRPMTLLWARSLRQIKDYKGAVLKFEEYMGLTPFWDWIDEIEVKTPSDKARFLQFFNDNFGFLSEMLEVIETARSAGDKIVEDRYTFYRKEIIDYLREAYKNL